MAWLGIEGHDEVVLRLRRCLQRGRLASTFLLVGPPGIGKCSFALRVAQSLLCQKSVDEQLEACVACPACQQVLADSHPDLQVLGLPEGKSEIPLELLIGGKEHRMREGLCHWIALKPSPGGRKIAIIDDADHLNQEGANCLLKTLEEPPPRAMIFLIGTSEQRQLPTIRSRAQVIRFRPLPSNLVARLLADQLGSDQPDQPVELARLAGGSLAAARQLADPELWQLRIELFDALARPDWNPLLVSRRIGQVVDAAAKEVPPRRARLRQVIEILAEFHRQLMRHTIQRPIEGDEALVQAVTATGRWWPKDQRAAADAIDRCLQARMEVDANANVATLLACWIDDLAQIATGQPTL
jgi:DNA polymerase-3 subunit delta'